MFLGSSHPKGLIADAVYSEAAIIANSGLIILKNMLNLWKS
jgi:hypothetical protein